MSGAAFEKNATIDPFFSYIGRNYRSEAITTVINVAQSWSIVSFSKNVAIGLNFSCGYKNAAIDPLGAIAMMHRLGL